MYDKRCGAAVLYIHRLGFEGLSSAIHKQAHSATDLEWTIDLMKTIVGVSQYTSDERTKYT